MMSKQTPKFLRQLLIFLCPLIIVCTLLVGSYIILDPFKVIYHYDNYHNCKDTLNVSLNKDHISTQNFINKRDLYKYDSFIFGNSRSIFYQTNEWLKYLPDSSVPYHFDASLESLFGIHKKIMFIDKCGTHISNALIIIDVTVLSRTTRNKAILFETDPYLLNNDNLYEFQKSFLLAYSNPSFLVAYYYSKLFHKATPWMLSYIDNKPFVYDEITNEIRYEKFEAEINNNQYYTPQRMESFAVPYVLTDRSNNNENQSVITDVHIEMLKKIHIVLTDHNTNYKIIINPLYNQEKFNQEDLTKLQQIFGSDNVYDFSGHNLFTEDYHNYYENSHYRPKVANTIMSIIYNPDKSQQTAQIDSLKNIAVQ